ncbi:protein lsr2 [Mycobacteroides abscessus subsp. bolletii 1513]|uniref:Nucleoid-associated protein Lsr2 n=2 Tax=Mycobacteroides abscessus TaxID=36809 RepID=A0A829QC74_9MYCO|nr:protein lsr2 [Mycobacteroides abscessus 21]EUA74122.1 protein lsr2 [Mycobacteroides abscessus subsp. bolletii 1513]
MGRARASCERTSSRAGSSGSGRGRASIDREQSAAIREWARKNGHNVSSRGRIPAEVVDAFNAAN